MYDLDRQFVQHGFDLLVAAEDPGIMEAGHAFEKLGATVETVQVDLATYDGVETPYTAIRATNRPVDAIAINAGVGVGGDFDRETDLRDELNLINLNVVSAVHLAKRVVKDMVARGNGRILFTSSIAALMPGSFEAVYAASKAFIQSFSEALRNELKDTGVTVPRSNQGRRRRTSSTAPAWTTPGWDQQEGRPGRGRQAGLRGTDGGQGRRHRGLTHEELR